MVQLLIFYSHHFFITTQYHGNYSLNFERITFLARINGGAVIGAQQACTVITEGRTYEQRDKVMCRDRFAPKKYLLCTHREAGQLIGDFDEVRETFVRQPTIPVNIYLFFC